VADRSVRAEVCATPCRRYQLTEDVCGFYNFDLLSIRDSKNRSTSV